MDGYLILVYQQERPIIIPADVRNDIIGTCDLGIPELGFPIPGPDSNLNPKPR